MSARPHRSIRRLTVAAAGLVTSSLAGGVGADAGDRCREVSGRYTERLAPDGCQSPGDLQTITGGTGDFAGATGARRASGTFDLVAGTGSSSVEGTICVP